jgi:hypothetical protein
MTAPMNVTCCSPRLQTPRGNTVREESGEPVYHLPRDLSNYRITVTFFPHAAVRLSGEVREGEAYRISAAIEQIHADEPAGCDCCAVLNLRVPPAGRERVQM